MLNGWGNFYFLLGTAAASLIGLMFIVTTLTRTQDAAAAERGQRLFMSPTVVNFSIVLAMSAIALVPNLGPFPHEIALEICAAFGLFYAAVTALHMASNNGQRPPHWTDPWFYGVLPLGNHVALSVSVIAISFWREAACDAVAGFLLLLLLLSIRNAWDLVTWIAPRRDRPLNQPDQP